MRLATTLCLVSALVILAGCCGAGGCGVAKAPAARAPAAYGSASGPSRMAYERAPTVVVREVSRRAPSYERSVRFTPPTAPAIPAARHASAKSTACPAPAPACTPVADPSCPDGNCGIPSLDDCCPGGNCGVPSLDSLLDPCK